MESKIERIKGDFMDKIVAKLVASKKMDELKNNRNKIKGKLETALELGMDNEGTIINLGIPGKYINMGEYIKGLSKILNVEKQASYS